MNQFYISQTVLYFSNEVILIGKIFNMFPTNVIFFVSETMNARNSVNKVTKLYNTICIYIHVYIKYICT